MLAGCRSYHLIFHCAWISFPAMAVGLSVGAALAVATANGMKDEW
jgi:hypothetical protein